MKARFWLALAAGLILAPPVGADDCRPYYLTPQPRSEAFDGGSSLLLEVRRPGIPPSYLLGTYHSADPRLRQRWDGLALLLAAVRPRLLVVERELALDDRGDDPRWLPRGQTLESVLADQPNLHTRMVAAARDYGLPLAALERARIWMVAGWISQAPAARGGDGIILDAYLQQQAAAQGIPLLPLETLAELARLYDDFSHREQARLLWEAVCNRPVNEAAIREQTEAYVANDPGGLYRAATGHGPSDPALGDKLLEVFVARRNDAFWHKLQPQLERGRVLVAVGALHLFGERGLVERLKGQGWRIRPLAPEKLTLTLKADQLPGLAHWVLDWAIGQGLEPSADALVDWSVEAIPEAGLRQQLCPGRNCRVDATYRPGEGRALLTTDRLALLTREAVAPKLLWRDDRLVPGTPGEGLGKGSYPAALVVREMVRHLLHRAGPEQADDTCHRRRILSRAIQAQQAYLLERGSPLRARGVALGAECPSVQRIRACSGGRCDSAPATTPPSRPPVPGPG